MSLVELSGVHKIFAKRPKKALARLQNGATREELRDDGITAAVIDASFTVEAGQIFVVMGLSGSGKSTLIRMVNGLLDPTSGSVVVGGEDLTTMDARKLRRVRREKISMVFQHFALLPHRTVGENAAYALKVKGINRADRERQAEEALAMVGLGGWGGSLPGDLSGGMRQRVGLARALAAGTEVLLMDEAFSALDPLIRREMQDQLIDLQTQLGKTVLFITHDLNEAMRIGDQIAMMRDGRIVQQGSAEQILNDPANDYVAQFVQDVDRTKVLTASSVMEPPVAVLGAGQGPRAAHKLMREHQLNSLMVVDRHQNLKGAITEEAAAEAVKAGQDTLDGLLTEAHRVSPDTTVADLFTASAEQPVPLAVVDGGRLSGVIARVTLLSALGNVGETERQPSTGNEVPSVTEAAPAAERGQQ